ncbi:hypothetical protein [Marispirochaeta sp.]|jgi:hypothetical protein|uniref:hypothetical protein n=1 Tax=Marispirochaeta sp. TaxID=2038653 RepID=UPI0029C6C475|nr:hypothetical protein [Marispirochaeta sp.]
MAKREERMNNKIYLRLFFAMVILFWAGILLVAQESQEDPLAAAFMENFSRANDETKLDILRDSVNYGADQMGPLYQQALEYVVNNSDGLVQNVQLQQIALVSAQLAGLSGYQPATMSLWELFDAYSEAGVRIAVLDALKRENLGNEQVFLLLNRWIERQISIFRAGGGINAQVVSQAVLTLSGYRDPRSFPQLLSLTVLGISQEISSRAQAGLDSIDGDYARMAEEVIQSYPAAEKLVALRTAVNREDLSNEQRASVCITALEVGNNLAVSDPANASTIRELRTLSVRNLGDLRWAEATSHIIQHFDLCIQELDRGIGSKSALLEAVAALGSMGAREAAVRLALYLDVINSFVENNQGYDEQITLAVVRNLGELKSKAGLNALLYLGYLDYSKNIRDAGEKARRAILDQ